MQVSGSELINLRFLPSANVSAPSTYTPNI